MAGKEDTAAEKIWREKIQWDGNHGGKVVTSSTKSRAASFFAAAAAAAAVNHDGADVISSYPLSTPPLPVLFGPTL